MNKSNVMEIKKTLKITQDYMPSIERICTCFVNGNKEKLISTTESYVSLEEEETFKYIEAFKGVLSGAIGKKLINLECGAEDAQKELYNTESKMFTDDAVRDAFFDKIIENYEFGENYVIMAGHGIYDAPVKTSDGAKLEDETNTYDFMIVAICPVHLTKAGLTLDMDTGRMVASKQVPIVEAPIQGFLYPAFNDRETDIHSLLFFTKKPDEIHNELIESLIGVQAPTSAVAQQRIFENILAEVTDASADFEIVKTLHENLIDLANQTEDKAEAEKLEKDDIKRILTDAGIDQNKLDNFDQIYERAGGTDDTEFMPQNLMILDKFNVQAPDIEIKVKPDRTGLVTKQKIDGKNCIVVTLEGDIELNGIQVSES